MKTYRHLFFDLDHTLWDFQANSAKTLHELIDEHDLENRLETPRAHFLETYYRINDEKWALYRAGKIDKAQLRRQRFSETFQQFGLQDAAFSSGFEEAYISRSPYQTTLIAGTRELLDYLVNSNKYKLHIITNGFEEVQHIKLTNSNLVKYFDVIMTSEKAGTTKPNATIFMEALRIAKASRKESLMIGDNLIADVIGAKNCGIDQVFFNPEKVKHQEKITYEIVRLEEIVQFL